MNPTPKSSVVSGKDQFQVSSLNKLSDVSYQPSAKPKNFKNRIATRAKARSQ